VSLSLNITEEKEQINIHMLHKYNLTRPIFIVSAGLFAEAWRRVYAGETEDTSVLLVDTVEDSSSPRGFFPQKRVVNMQLRN